MYPDLKSHSDPIVDRMWERPASWTRQKNRCYGLKLARGEAKAAPPECVRGVRHKSGALSARFIPPVVLASSPQKIMNLAINRFRGPPNVDV